VADEKALSKGNASAAAAGAHRGGAGMASCGIAWHASIWRALALALRHIAFSAVTRSAASGGTCIRARAVVAFLSRIRRVAGGTLPALVATWQHAALRGTSARYCASFMPGVASAVSMRQHKSAPAL
jgi:hypothetical protein